MFGIEDSKINIDTTAKVLAGAYFGKALLALPINGRLEMLSNRETAQRFAIDAEAHALTKQHFGTEHTDVTKKSTVSDKKWGAKYQQFMEQIEARMAPQIQAVAQNTAFWRALLPVAWIAGAILGGLVVYYLIQHWKPNKNIVQSTI